MAAIQQVANFVTQCREVFQNHRTEVVAALLDVEKAYDKVWRRAVTYKLWK